jgi:hypothetical protein
VQGKGDYCNSYIWAVTRTSKYSVRRYCVGKKIANGAFGTVREAKDFITGEVRPASRLGTLSPSGARHQAGAAGRKDPTAVPGACVLQEAGRGPGPAQVAVWLAGCIH